MAKISVKAQQKIVDDAVRVAAEGSLITFINLVHPSRMLGGVHEEYLTWLTRDGHKTHQLGLIPRDHQKSALMAYRVAWTLAGKPHWRFLYLSSTSNLAQKQLTFIKDILTSSVFRRYWPQHVNKMKSKRAKWSESEIILDHPKRKEEFIRDPSIFTAGLTTTVTGLHFDVVVADDVVVFDNAYNREGRKKVAEQMSYMASILGGTGELWAVGTRYDSNDFYQSMREMHYEVFDEEGNVIAEEPLYEVFERKVEDSAGSRGIGEFIWPRQQRQDGTWFGFDRDILAKKKAQYENHAQFMAQYYNITSTNNGAGILSQGDFQYYDKHHLFWKDGFLYFKRDRLNVFASVDFAYTRGKLSDFTAITVVGMDSNNNYYILDIDRFKTGRISDYYDHLLSLHTKWGFRKLIAEVVAAQEVIVNDLKENYIKKFGLGFSIEANKVTASSGKKHDRIMAVLEPRYKNGQVYHYRGGNNDFLEDELTSSRPSHDDVMDALAACIEKMVPPNRHNPFASLRRDAEQKSYRNIRRSRFGGTIA